MWKTGGAIVAGPLALGLVSLLVACARAPESNQIASTIRCEFGPGQSLGPLVNSPVFDGSPTVSADETELIFTSGRNGQQELFVSTRPSKQDAWSEPVNLGPLVNDSISDDFSPRLSNDGKALYFGSFDRREGFGTGDMYVATRASRQHPWGQATNLGPRLNTEEFEAFPTPSADGKMLYFNRSTTFDSQDSDIYVTSRSGPDDEWSEPQRVPSGINTERAEFSPAVTADGNTLYFASERSGTIEIWVSTRGHPAEAWGTPEKLGADINVPRAMTLAPFLSSDQRSLYYMSARPDVSAGEACTPRSCFDRLDLYVATVNCRPG
jgi:Tol biopolymer transport system component